MLSALEFWDAARRQLQAEAEAHRNYAVIAAVRNMDHWTQADYMDFAERYADYVCDFEKRNHYVNAATEEQHAKELMA